MVKKYEGMFLTHNKEARKDTDYVADHVKELIAKVGGEIVQMTKWDERKLAYPVKGVSHGVYFLVWFTGDSQTDSALRAEIRLSSLILRHLTLALDEFPEHPIETYGDMQTRLQGEARDTLDGGEMNGGRSRDRDSRDRGDRGDRGDRDRDRDRDREPAGSRY